MTHTNVTNIFSLSALLLAIPLNKIICGYAFSNYTQIIKFFQISITFNLITHLQISSHATVYEEYLNEVKIQKSIQTPVRKKRRLEDSFESCPKSNPTKTLCHIIENFGVTITITITFKNFFVITIRIAIRIR